ncbi:MAG: sodium:proton antiporter [Gammaproteobacteria bacterium]|nr:sodium:proton antiporter [Gammaproteobacteria bacterium]
MNLFNILSFLFTIAAILGYINYRYIKLQSSIAITMTTMLLTVGIIFISSLGINVGEKEISLAFSKIDFHSLLMNGMLSFLLFAGALNVSLDQLLEEKWEVIVLAIGGTVISTFIVGGLTFYFLAWLGQPLAFIHCLLFGALISPTDPIAVLAVFKKLKAPKSLDTRLAGESLFNDGVGIVLFVTIYAVAYGQHSATVGAIAALFLQQAIGGILYGMLLGYIGYRLIKPINDSLQEIFITLAIATGGYSLAQTLNISGPLAMVVAGMFIGNRQKMFYMSEKTRVHLVHFWEVIDSAFNAILFLLIGLELIALQRSFFELISGLGAIIIVLVARIISVGVPMQLMRLKRRYEPFATSIMIWGGLRGGLAIALALALPAGPAKALILPMTYATVLFSILVQGLSISPLVKLCKRRIVA